MNRFKEYKPKKKASAPKIIRNRKHKAKHYTPRHAVAINWVKARIIFVGVLLALAWLVLWVRAYQVQIVQGDKLAKLAGRQHVAAEYISGERGKILDRNGRILAQSIRCLSVYAKPVQIKDAEATASELSQIFGISSHRLKKQLTSSSPFVWVARQVSDRDANLVKALKLPGVHLVSEYKRLYPNRHLAGQLLGFTDYDGKGLEGIEFSFDKELAGKRNKTIVQRDAKGNRLYLNGTEKRRQYHGKDIHLSLDVDIQALTEAALAKAVQKNNANNGTALVVEVKTGEVLAWAQYPFFNPNIRQQYSPIAWRNRIALDALEPGSTLKPFTVAAALQEKLVTPETVYDCEKGKWVVAGKTIRDTKALGKLSVAEIIRYSSNIGVAKIGSELGATDLYNYLASLGFGSRTGLQLPGESKGILRPPGKWKQIDLANISFGQGIAVTPLQQVKAFLSLARGGKEAPVKILANEPDPQGSGKRIFKQQVAWQIMSMMRDVVEEGGTGKAMRIQGIEIGGKTGTAQKSSARGGYGNKYLASFVALIPAKRPKYIIQVMVDEPTPRYYGSQVAAPAARSIAMQTLTFLGEMPQPTVVQIPAREKKQLPLPPQNISAISGKTTNVPNVVGLSLRRAMEIFSQAGNIPQIKGEGSIVARQEPGAGTAWSENMQTVLWLGNISGEG